MNYLDLIKFVQNETTNGFMSELHPLEQERLRKQIRLGVDATKSELLAFKSALLCTCYLPHFRRSPFPEFQNMDLPAVLAAIKKVKQPLRTSENIRLSSLLSGPLKEAIAKLEQK